MARVSFLHISDLHISKFPNLKKCSKRTPEELKEGFFNHAYCASHDPGRLKAIVQLSHKLRDRLDAIVISGDIATTGLINDLEPAFTFVNGPCDEEDTRLSNGFPTLSGTGLDIFLLPGNHDRYKTLFDYFGYIPGGKEFDRIFAKYWDDDVKVNPIVKPDLALGIIAADFNLRRWQDSDPAKSPIGFYAQGRVYEDILDKLKNFTNSFVDEHKYDREVVLIWAIHFPPAAPQIDSYSELLEGENLISSADENKIFLIISGHLHEPFQLSSPPESVTPNQWNFQIFGVGTGSQFDSDNHCQVITIDNSGDGLGLGLEHFRFSEIENAFIPVEN